MWHRNKRVRTPVELLRLFSDQYPLLYSHKTTIRIHIHAKHNHTWHTNFNERTNTLFYKNIYLSHFILERVDVGWVWEVSWRRRQTDTYWPKVLLIIALLSHLGLVAQPWVTEGPKPSVCRWLSGWHLVPNCLKPELPQAVCGTWLYKCLTYTCFRCSSAYLHRCISWLTARSRVNI